MNTVNGPRRLLPGSRSHVLSNRELREMAAADAEANGEGAIHDEIPERPKTRAECIDGPRPCPWAGCRWHLLLDVSHGRIKINFPEALNGDFDSLANTCALDIVDRGGASLEDVGKAINITRERVRQIEEGAVAKLRRQGLHLNVLIERGEWPR